MGKELNHRSVNFSEITRKTDTKEKREGQRRGERKGECIWEANWSEWWGGGKSQDGLAGTAVGFLLSLSRGETSGSWKLQP